LAAEEPKVRDALLVALIDWAAAAERSQTRWSAPDLRALASAADRSAWRKQYLTAVAKHDVRALRNLSFRRPAFISGCAERRAAREKN
jgi:hypothetical protein